MTDEEQRISNIAIKVSAIDARTEAMLGGMNDHRAVHVAIDKDIDDQAKDIAELRTLVKVLAWVAGTSASAWLAAGVGFLVSMITRNIP